MTFHSVCVLGWSSVTINLGTVRELNGAPRWGFMLQDQAYACHYVLCNGVGNGRW